MTEPIDTGLKWTEAARSALMMSRSGEASRSGIVRLGDVWGGLAAVAEHSRILNELLQRAKIDASAWRPGPVPAVNSSAIPVVLGEEVQSVIRTAALEASIRGHDVVGTEHLFASLLQVDRLSNVVPRVGVVDIEEMWSVIEQLYAEGLADLPSAESVRSHRAEVEDVLAWLRVRLSGLAAGAAELAGFRQGSHTLRCLKFIEASLATIRGYQALQVQEKAMQPLQMWGLVGLLVAQRRVVSFLLHSNDAGSGACLGQISSSSGRLDSCLRRMSSTEGTAAPWWLECHGDENLIRFVSSAPGAPPWEAVATFERLFREHLEWLYRNLIECARGLEARRPKQVWRNPVWAEVFTLRLAKAWVVVIHATYVVEAKGRVDDEIAVIRVALDHIETFMVNIHSDALAGIKDVALQYVANAKWVTEKALKAFTTSTWDRDEALTTRLLLHDALQGMIKLRDVVEWIDAQ